MARRDLGDLRPGAMAIAYRMLGSVASAEDVTQEALIRLEQARARGEDVSSPAAYLATVVTRLSIDELRSARARREQYVGEWLPEPVRTSAPDDPSAHAETADSLSVAFLVVLERLTPEQRAVFLLREVFDYDYEAIGDILGRTPAAVRQLAVRARRHIEHGRPRFEASREQRNRLADQFFAALGEGDLASLERLLASEASLHGDGGGKAPSIPRPIVGRVRVAQTLVSLARNTPAEDGFVLERVELNGEPAGLVLDPHGRLVVAMVVSVADGRVQSVRNVLNPDKLGRLGRPVADLVALLRARSRDRRGGTPG